MNTKPSNLEYDNILRLLNEALIDPHYELVSNDLEEMFATIHVVGAPRSGTTLTMQLMASCLDIAYPSNLSAMFWNAPVIGSALHEKHVDKSFLSNFQSDYGQTDSLHEPHEFGRFWTTLLDYKDMVEIKDHNVDWPNVANTIAAMTHGAGKAYAFKSFLPIWHLEEIAGVCKKSIFVHIKRDRIENAISLLRARRCYKPGTEAWVGLKPLACKNYDNANLATQVASQVYFIEKRISEQLKNIPEDRLLKLDYEDVCLTPNIAINEIAKIITNNQNDTISVIREIETLRASYPTKYADEEEVRAVRLAFEALDMTSNGF